MTPSYDGLACDTSVYLRGSTSGWELFMPAEMVSALMRPPSQIVAQEVALLRPEVFSMPSIEMASFMAGEQADEVWRAFLGLQFATIPSLLGCSLVCSSSCVLKLFLRDNPDESMKMMLWALLQQATSGLEKEKCLLPVKGNSEALLQAQPVDPPEELFLFQRRPVPGLNRARLPLIRPLEEISITQADVFSCRNLSETGKAAFKIVVTVPSVPNFSYVHELIRLLPAGIQKATWRMTTGSRSLRLVIHSYKIISESTLRALLGLALMRIYFGQRSQPIRLLLKVMSGKRILFHDFFSEKGVR